MSNSVLKSCNRSPARGRSSWRWVTLALAVVLLSGGFLGLGLKLGRLGKLRRQYSTLQAATVDIRQLRQDNAELLRLRAAAEQSARAQKEQAELAGLRADVEQLRMIAQEFPALRAESRRLQAERAAAAARAGVAAEEDPFAEARTRAQRIACVSNLKQVGLAARIWANENKDVFPENFLSLSNELSTPRILVCPGDTARQPALNWREFNPASASYEWLSPGLPENDPAVVLTRCPIHHNVGMTDGSVTQLGPRNSVVNVDGRFRVVFGNFPRNRTEP